MEHPTEPALPYPLPRPLSDPLRRYRWFLLFLVPPFYVATLVGWLLPSIGPRLQRAPAESASVAALSILLLCTLRLMPRRTTNAIYLRSFRNDAATGTLRIAAQSALGRAFRLSGIRDPRHRWPAIIRHLLYILFLIRYAQPRFMNLEAGCDWKARLWRSLGEARCALIDATDLTPFVREEVELAVRCLGFHRVLFLGADSHTAGEWRQVILTALGSPDVPPERIQVALWADTATGRAAFRDQVRAFAERLPADPPGLNAAAFPDTASSADPGGNAVTGDSWRMFLLANVIGVGIGGALTWAQKYRPDAGLAWFLPTVIYDTLALLLLLQYFAECGSLRQRLRIGSTFLFAIVFAGLFVKLQSFSPFEGLRSVASRTRTANNLKQIGLAVHNYEDTHRLHPTSGWSPDLGSGQTSVTNGTYGSTFFHLLPYIEQSQYMEFHPDESWGRPRNFLTPYRGVADAGPDAPSLAAGTSYASVFAYDRRTALADITDGTSNTLSIRESAQDSGPWGRGDPARIRSFLCPADRPYLDTGMPFGGTQFAEDGLFQRGGSIGWNAAMADGSVRFLQEGIRPHFPEPRTRKTGGEEFFGDW
jgi:hypothetical protein